MRTILARQHRSTVPRRVSLLTFARREMSYASFTLRKPKRKKEVVTLFDDSTNSIYSTLSKKPADLKTTDIDLTAIRIFLSDGSHRTISSTPSTTCGEILNRLLDKLGLAQQKSSYRLQIRYQFGEARIAKDTDKLSELNIHVWDSVDRIYLCKLSPLPLRRKRLTSLDSSELLDESENIYENCAVVASHSAVTPSEDVESSQDPVLVNDKLARGFAKAWNVGSEQQEAGNQKGQKPLRSITSIRQFEGDDDAPRRSYASYTLDRKRKNLNTKKRSAMTPSPSRTSTKLAPFPRNGSTPYIVTDGGGAESGNRDIQVNGTTPNHFRMLLSPDKDEKSVISIQAFEQSNTPQGTKTLSSSCDANSKNLTPQIFLSVENNPASNSLKRFGSEGDLIAASGANDREKMWTSSLDLRDSGYQEHLETGSQCSIESVKSCTNDSSPTVVKLRSHRRRSISAVTVPASLQATKKKSSSVPSLAVHKIQTSPSRDESRPEDRDKPNFNAACMKSYKSMELLTGEDVETIQTNLISNCSQPLTSCELAKFPEVPKRVSSHMENCTVSDEYLLNQGKRLSQVLNLSRQPKKQEKSHFRLLMNKIAGTFQMKKNKSVCSLPQTPPESECKLPSLYFPTGPPPPVAPRPQIISPTHSSYIRLSSISGPNMQTSGGAQQGKSTLSPSLSGPAANKAEYLQVLMPSAPSPKSQSSTSYENMKVEENCECFYQVPPPASPRQSSSPAYENRDLGGNPECYYQVPPTPSQAVYPPSYENRDLRNNPQCLYQVPPSSSKAMDVDEDRTEIDTSIYENKSIEIGCRDEIMFNSSQLHVYSTPKSVLAEENTALRGRAEQTGVQRALTYENHEIHSSSKNGISIGGEELHIYQVPPLNSTPSSTMESSVLRSTPPPPLPKPLPALPPKPNNVPSPPPLPPKPKDSNDPSLSPKPFAQSPQTAPLVASKSSSKSLKKQNEKVVRVKASTNPNPLLVQVKRASLLKTNTGSAVYYEDVADWLKHNDYSKLNWSIPANNLTNRRPVNKTSTSNNANSKVKSADMLNTQQENDNSLCATVSEPDLRDSQIYEYIPEEVEDQLDEDNTYIVMVGAGPIVRHSSMEELRLPKKMNSKGQLAPKCPPKPNTKQKTLPILPSEYKRYDEWKSASTKTRIGNVKNKIAALLNGEQIQGTRTQAANHPPAPISPPSRSLQHQMSTPQVSLAGISTNTTTNPVRPNKLPILPPPRAQMSNLTSSPSSLPFPTPHLTPPPQFAASPSPAASKVVKKGPLPPTPTPSPLPPPQPSLSTISGVISPANLFTTPSFPLTNVSTVNLHKKGPLSPTPPPAPPLSTLPRGSSSASMTSLPSPTPTSKLTSPGTSMTAPAFPSTCAPSISTFKPLKKGPLPQPPSPTPPPLSTLPRTSSAAAMSPSIPPTPNSNVTTPATPFMTPPFQSTPSVSTFKPTKKDPLPQPPSPIPPPPPPLSTLPRASSSSAMSPSVPHTPTSKPIKKGPLPMPPTPTAPPIAPLPGASPAGTPTPCFPATPTSKLLKKGPLPPIPTPPPPPVPPLPGPSSAGIVSPAFPPSPTAMNSPPPPPPPPISTIPRTVPVSLHNKAPPPPPPPPPPPVSCPPKAPSLPPLSGAKSMKPATTTGSRQGGGAKTSNSLTRQTSNKSTAEMLSAELFERIKGLARRLDDEETERGNVYNNTVH